jgi:DNA-binding beta-propeller fold protein YncE
MPSISARTWLWLSIVGAGMSWTAEAQATPPAYTLFESGQVRPLALSPDKKTLFAVNTPDGRLEVYDVRYWGLEHRISIPVGVEPVAVAARNNTEVWVVNHLSDSVSVVYVGTGAANRVTRTLLVGDEPRDLVFAGPLKNRAFITTAHRGQNTVVDPQLTTKSVGRADVWVFDGANPGSSFGGTPMTVVTLFADTPRALAVSADGSKVYAAAHFSGNRTTTIDSVLVPDGPESAGGTPAPNTNHAGIAEPSNPLIVKYDGQHWVDEIGRWWDDKVKFSLPDKDVFVIDANAAVPVQVGGSAGFYAGVGAILYNMVVNPVSGKVYVSNTTARNEVRFAGPGIFTPSTVRGHFAENNITVLDPQAHSVQTHHLNPHLDYDAPLQPLPNEDNELSMALPQGMAITADGNTLYVAALGSDKIGVYDTDALENDGFWPDPCEQIQVGGGGPTGVLLDESRGRLYVMTRFDNAISVIDTDDGDEFQHVTMYNPEPASVTQGRRFLYDAQFGSARGDSACATCHVSGDMDHLAWDLGNPDGDVMTAPGPFKTIFLPDFPIDFHPMKGPMTTQSLRGLANHGSMHWRGDKTFVPAGTNNQQPNTGSFDEVAAFAQFNMTFVDVHGRTEPISAADMQKFSDFALQLTYPPNPIRKLDNSLTADQAAGKQLYINKPATLGMTCQFCHVVDPAGNAQYGVARPGFFGSDGSYVGTEFVQTMKVPQLRNAYQKVGKFGLPRDPFINPQEDDSFAGDQIRGFGYTHEGSMDSVFGFLSQIGFVEDPVFNPGGLESETPTERRQVEAYVLAIDSNMAPIVGQQITLTSTNGAVVGPRIDLMKARASAGECDLVVHGQRYGEQRGYQYKNNAFLQDEAGAPNLSDAQLRARASIAQQELTYTCAPPGSGRRMGIDRDLDGILDANDCG